MHLEPTARPEHILRVNARLITSSTMLHLSADELERAVNQEQMENPALEVIVSRICLFCGTPLYGQACSNCGHFEQPALTMSKPATNDESSPQSPWNNQQHFFAIPTIRDTYDYDTAEDEDECDPLARIPAVQTLAEVLLQQLEALISPDDALIAEQLVGNLNERGYLEISVNETAEHLQVPLERVEYALHQLQTLEPVGIGARNLRECLLLQLVALSEREAPPRHHGAGRAEAGRRQADIPTRPYAPLLYTLIDRHLHQLGHNQFHEIARELKVPEQQVHQAYMYIRSMFHPFPAHAYKADTSSTHATYLRPDVIIHRGESGFEVELIEEKRYGFHIAMQHDAKSASTEVLMYMRHYSEQAKFFVDCIQHRWRSLKRIAALLVDYQREFLEQGVRYLHPLTRTEVATRLNLDKGTISRATANKYVLLPNGRLMPMSDFFDGSLGVKHVLRELIMAEESKRRLSDEELARLLAARGISLARRTVAKYREAMGIGSSRER